MIKKERKKKKNLKSKEKYDHDRQTERKKRKNLSPSILSFVFVSFFAHLSVAFVIQTANRYIKVTNESCSDLKCLA